MLKRFSRVRAKQTVSPSLVAVADNSGVEPRLVSVSRTDRAERSLLPLDAKAFYQQLSGGIVSDHWSGVFSFSCWIAFRNSLCASVNLVFRYRDSERMKTVFIDRCVPGFQHSVLMNGQMPVEIKGELREVGLFLVGVDGGVDLCVDECLISLVGEESVTLARLSKDADALEA